MVRLIAIAAVALSLAAVPVMGASKDSRPAAEVSVSAPVQPASLTSGRLDMVLFYVPGPGGDFDVTATFLDRGTPGAGRSKAPINVQLTMQPGDQVAFRVPGYPEARYHFSRIGERVIARVEVERPKNV